jgi:dTDP-4-dehydrorhamnose 3,5-epimerase
MNDAQPVKDSPTVTADGQRLRSLIDGVKFRPSVTHLDERGELSEIYSSAWGFHAEQIVYAYNVMIRAGRTKGWTKHLLQDDMQFVVVGTVKYVLFDDRPDSATHRRINEFTFGDRHRGLLVIPAGVYHAVQNVGETEAFLVNLPTRPYEHGDPDKYRLPLENDVIPYKFT